MRSAVLLIAAGLLVASPPTRATATGQVTQAKEAASDERPGQSRTVTTERPRFEMIRTIVDSAGEPVASAPVVAWYLGSRVQTKTDAQGRFKLSGVPKSGVWVFVDAQGFRFSGQFVKRLEESSIKLVRADEPDPLGRLSTLQATPVSAELLNGAVDGLITALDVYTERPGIQEFRKRRAREFVSKLAPDRVEPSGTDYQRVSMLARSDFAKALSHIEQAHEDQRLMLMGYTIRKVATLTAEQRGELIKRALPLLDGAGSEDLTFWGDVLIENGQPGSGRALLERAFEKLPSLEDSDRAAFSRGFWAWSYAPIDYRKSLDAISGVTDTRKRTRYLTNIAHKLADVEPQSAVTVLEMLDENSAAALKVVARMADKGPIQARRVAFRIPDAKTKARALAQIANSNPAAKDAKSLIARAYDILTTETNAGDRGPRSSLPIAVSLLPTVERVDPGKLREYFWRTLSLRRNVSYGSESRALGPHGKDRALRFADPVLALALSRYDRTVARQIALDREDETLDHSAEHGPFRAFAALTVLDPAAAVAKAEAEPTATDREVAAKMSAWQQIVQVLHLDTPGRFKSVVEGQYFLLDPRKIDH